MRPLTALSTALVGIAFLLASASTIASPQQPATAPAPGGLVINKAIWGPVAGPIKNVTQEVQGMVVGSTLKIVVSGSSFGGAISDKPNYLTVNYTLNGAKGTRKTVDGQQMTIGFGGNVPTTNTTGSTDTTTVTTPTTTTGTGTTTSDVPAGYARCATEGGSYTFTSMSDVAYGANGHFAYKTNVLGPLVFNSQTFAEDPAPGVVKAGYFKATPVTGKNATNVFYDNGTQKGSFLQVGENWVEGNVTGNTINNHYFETGRDDWSIYLRDAVRDRKIQLDLYKKVITFNNSVGATGEYGKVIDAKALSPEAGPSGYTRCAGEGGSYTFNTLVDLAYGANAQYNKKTSFMGTMTFDPANFGGDPAPYYLKAGYYKASVIPGSGTGPAGYTRCAGEGGSCLFNTVVDVAYGANGHFVYKPKWFGPVAFNLATFGSDPAPNVLKSGYYKPSDITGTAVGPTGYTRCAGEGVTFMFNSPVDVAYGAKGLFTYKSAVNGNFTFSPASFGGFDPAPNVVKSGWCKPSTSTTAPVLPNVDGLIPLAPADAELVMKWIAVEVAAADIKYCYRQSRDRGVGRVVSICPPGTVKDPTGDLCYPACPSGYDMVGPLCWRSCPSGFSEAGVSCTKPPPYTRGGPYEQSITCPPKWIVQGTGAARYCWDQVVFPPGLSYPPLTCGDREYDGVGYCYDRCRAGYHVVAIGVCSPDCPPGMRDDGEFCAKDTKQNGVGTPKTCAPGEEQPDGKLGLCYPACRAGYHGVGPKCWQNCPSTQPVDCAAGCAVDAVTCAETTADMVTSVLDVVMNIATLGEGEAATAAKNEAKMALKEAAAAAKKADKEALNLAVAKSRTAVQKYVTECAQGFEKLTCKKVANKLKEEFKEEALKWVKEEYVKVNFKIATGDDFTVDDLRDLAGLDPTGVAGVVAAYTQQICPDDHPFPTLSRKY